MKAVLKYTGYILFLLIVGYFIWRFYYILVWLLVAAIISFMVHPLVKFFDRIHFKKFRIPHSLSSLIALIIVVLVFAGLVAVYVPLIISQAQTISSIDVTKLSENFEEPLQWLDEKMHNLGALSDGQTIQEFIVIKAKSLINTGNLGTMLGNLLNTAGNIFIALFSILFISFFFIRDDNMFEETLLLFIPLQHHTATRKVVAESKDLLVRYYLGVLLELIGVMSLITIGLWIFGIKNALLIGFFGGIMNIIPYIGPVIGSAIGIMLGITSTLASGSFDELVPSIIKLTGVFVAVNFIDNNILVPYIYAKSVKSHPLEIFLVIIIGGGLAGLVGMLLAVPVYTLLRVIAKEFLQQFRVIKKLTQRIDDG